MANSPVELTPLERSTIQNIVSGVTPAGEQVVFRARILLDLDSGMPQKEIAARYDTREATVSDIKKRFLNDGMAILIGRPKSGRPPKITFEEAEARLDPILEEYISGSKQGQKLPSVKELSSTLQIRDGILREVLKAKGLMDDRRRSWDFVTSGTTIPRSIEIVGIQVSLEHQVLVVRTEDKPLSEIHELQFRGYVTTRNKAVAFELEKSETAHGCISLEEALSVCSRPRGPRMRNYGKVDAFDFVQSVMTADKDSPSVEYHIFIAGDTLIKDRHSMLSGTVIHETESATAWISQIEGIVDVLSEVNNESPLSKQIARGIEDYLRHADSTSDAFEWRKGTALEEAETSGYASEEAEPSLNMDEAPAGTMVFTARIKNADGTWTEKTITSGVPADQAEIDMSNQESYLRSFAMYEQTAVSLSRDMVRGVLEDHMSASSKKNTK